MSHRREIVQDLIRMIIDRLGGKCQLCGFSDYRALEIHHPQIARERSKRSFSRNRGFSLVKYYSKILQDVMSGNKEHIEVLCANCHKIQREELSRSR